MKDKIVIFAGPSGVGKATIENELFKIKDLHLQFSCSATTRLPRETEKEGNHYYFLSKKAFNQKIKNDEFLEWNKHFSNKYGTLKSEISRISSAGFIPFLEVDVEGAKQIIEKQSQHFNLITIFIMPPSITELERRIRQRNTEKEPQLKARLKRYHKEIEASKSFEHIIINHEIHEVVKKISKIIKEA